MNRNLFDPLKDPANRKKAEQDDIERERLNVQLAKLMYARNAAAKQGDDARVDELNTEIDQLTARIDAL